RGSVQRRPSLEANRLSDPCRKMGTRAIVEPAPAQVNRPTVREVRSGRRHSENHGDTKAGDFIWPALFKLAQIIGQPVSIVPAGGHWRAKKLPISCPTAARIFVISL